jgi:archaellum component FlaF (FlaF/FlaG flagellin family)
LDKTITTVLLIVAGVICSVFLFNSVYPMINRSSAAMVSMTDKIDDRMKSRIDIVHATGSADRQTVYIWIKNVGSTRIETIEESDIFLGPDGDFMRIPHQSNAGGTYPRWTYDIENDTEWGIGATVKITVTYDVDPGPGTYFIKVVIPNGIAAEYYFSM